MAKFTTIDGNTKISFEYTATTDKVQSILGDAAEYLWNHGYGDHGTENQPILFTSLTNQQKLDLIDAHLKDVIVNLANTFKSTKAQEEARIAEEANEYSL